MNKHSITLLYIKHLTKPLEALIKNPNFTTKYTKEEQQTINTLLLHQYQTLEQLMKEE